MIIQLGQNFFCFIHLKALYILNRIEYFLNSQIPSIINKKRVDLDLVLLLHLCTPVSHFDICKYVFLIDFRRTLNMSL